MQNKDDGVSQTSAPLTLGTKKTCMDTFPDLQIVVSRWIALHEAELNDDNYASF